MIYYSLGAGTRPAPGWINLAAPQQIERARLPSACTSFYALVASHGVDSDEGLVQSLVETGDGLSQVFTLLDYHLQPSLGQAIGEVIDFEKWCKVSGMMLLVTGCRDAACGSWHLAKLKINNT